MAITKSYLSGKEFCRVTFTLPVSLSKTVKTAHVVGDFNNWDTGSDPMKQRKNGQFYLSLKLKSNKEYQFRYLLDGTTWKTDVQADGVIPAPYADQYNAIISI
jgi:1,4-alpha-glucan branching enzyme